MPLSITTTDLGNGVVGYAFSIPVLAGGGTEPYNWSATGLPDGLSISSDGTISGTPSAAGSNTVSLTVTDAVGSTDTVYLSLEIYYPVRIATESLDDGTLGEVYLQQLCASQGRAPMTWICTDLPAGLTLAAGDRDTFISGTPTEGGTYSCHFSVTDTASSSTDAVTDSKTLTITIASGTLTFTTTGLPDGKVDEPYLEESTAAVQLAAADGEEPYNFSGSGLPGGLSMSSDGIIDGTPTTKGDYLIVATVKDSSTPPRRGTKEFWITIKAPDDELTVLIYVIKGNPLSDASIAGWSDTWGQPRGVATGAITERPGGAITLVRVFSRNGGGACNSVDTPPNHSGTIQLFIRSKVEGDFLIKIFGSVVLGATGPYGSAIGKLKVNDRTVIDGYVSPTKTSFSDSGNFETTLHLRDAWTKVAEFEPQIGIPDDFGGVLSAGWAVGAIQYLSATRQ